MNTKQLIKDLEPGDELMVANESFTYAGIVTVQLDGGDVVYWLFDDEENLLSVAPATEELLFFQAVVEEMVPDDEVIMYRTNTYELSYEDAGVITETDGDVLFDEEDRYEFFDYESESGELVRIVTNETTGENRTYIGHELVEDDIQQV